MYFLHPLFQLDMPWIIFLATQPLVEYNKDVISNVDAGFKTKNTCSQGLDVKNIPWTKQAAVLIFRSWSIDEDAMRAISDSMTQSGSYELNTHNADYKKLTSRRVAGCFSWLQVPLLWERGEVVVSVCTFQALHFLRRSDKSRSLGMSTSDCLAHKFKMRSEGALVQSSLASESQDAANQRKQRQGSL